MTGQGPLAADRDFFQYLLTANVEKLNDLLTDDFLLIAVMQGSEIPKAALLNLLETGQLKFQAIQPSGVKLRSYGSAAIVTGTTEMRGAFGPEISTVHSRYTHVYIRQDAGWRLASAQGTSIDGN